jgi:hypothetical protein
VSIVCRIPNRIVVLVLSLLSVVFGLPAAATPIFVDEQVNVFFGTATLVSASSKLLSTKHVVFVETQGLTTPQTAIDGLAGLGLDLSAQIAADPLVTAIVPSFVTSSIAGFADANGLGLVWDGTVPTAAEIASFAQLTTQPVPFTVTSDSGLLAVGSAFEFSYVSDISVDQVVVEYTTNVSFFQRDLTEQVPEPATLSFLGAALLGFAALRRSRAA